MDGVSYKHRDMFVPLARYRTLQENERGMVPRI